MSLHEANNLERARVKREFSVSELCQLANISSQYWYQLISGQRMPSFPLTCWLSILLQEPIESLFNTTIVALQYFTNQDVELFARKKG